MNTPPPERGLLLVLSAPSGAGKTSLARRLLREMPEARFSVSYTTRAPRGEEKDGVDYCFVDVATFRKKIEQEELAEWAEVHGHFYGTSNEAVTEVRRTGGIAVFDIDVQGGQAIAEKYLDAVRVFILPPSLEELERRLRDRGTDSEETIARRMLAARSEIERGIGSYDYLLVNDDFERAYTELRSVVIAERRRRGRADLGRLRRDLGVDRPTLDT